MKVLTLHQPWASLVTCGVKSIETRSWSTEYRGPLAIHAAARKPRRIWSQDTPAPADPIVMGRCYDIWEDENNPGQFAYDWCGPLGAIVATCTLVDVVPIVGLDVYLDTNGCRTGKAGFVYVNGPPSTSRRSLLERYRWNGRRYENMLTEDTSAQAPYGDFTAGRFAWLLSGVEPVDPPVPFRGGQGLTRSWEPNDG